ncbi:hypothetical protein KGO95_01735 [Patescibacteria group bacterium]|nr:hypothetical protein [Patescibacteria group bacterium]
MRFSDISFVYLLNRLLQRLVDFVRHWYVDGFFQAVDWMLDILEKLDRSFALRITVKYWLQPLYQDYTMIGYVWGFIFRTVRILIALVVYLLLIACALALFLAWAAIPLWVLYNIFTNL